MSAAAEAFRANTRAALAALGLDISPLAPWLEAQVVWTAAHESGGYKYRRQVGGPARGLCQQEPARVDELHADYLDYHADLEKGLTALAIEENVANLPEGDALEKSDTYAAAICILQYIRHAANVAPPAPADVDGLAAYWKRFYNTAEGAGTVAEFVADGRSYVTDDVA